MGNTITALGHISCPLNLQCRLRDGDFALPSDIVERMLSLGVRRVSFHAQRTCRPDFDHSMLAPRQACQLWLSAASGYRAAHGQALPTKSFRTFQDAEVLTGSTSRGF
eukprot:3988813-Amphidinium_carterae.2